MYITCRKTISPAGELMLAESGGRLCMCDWTASHRHAQNIKRLGGEMKEGKSRLLLQAEEELHEYFAGKRQEFTVPLLLVGTGFQQKVWQELQKIAYGDTVSYGQLAERMGCPQAVRAVANANASNAISIFVPCHRVIGKDGSLTGYAGGLVAKQLLRDIEAVVAGQKLF